MTQHAPVLIVLLPLTASLLCMLFSRISKNLGSWIVMASIAGAFANACMCLTRLSPPAAKPGITGWVAGRRRSVLNLRWIH